MSGIKETKIGYNFNPDNYVYTEATNDISVDELTVTITLNEYKKLVIDQATMLLQIDNAEKGKYARETENSDLRKENKKLQAEMYELKKKLEKLEENADSMQQTSECRSAFITPRGTEEAEE